MPPNSKPKCSPQAAHVSGPAQKVPAKHASESRVEEAAERRSEMPVSASKAPSIVNPCSLRLAQFPYLLGLGRASLSYGPYRTLYIMYYITYNYVHIYIFFYHIMLYFLRISALPLPSPRFLSTKALHAAARLLDESRQAACPRDKRHC